MKTKSIVVALFLCFVSFWAQAKPAFGDARLLNEGWRFTRGDVSQGFIATLDDSKWRLLDLPHDWSVESAASPYLASATGYLPGGIGWYRKTIDVDAAQKGKSMYIYFEGVYNNSEVWINGNYLGKRPNGYVSFMYELTPYLRYGEPNVIAVKVDHSRDADSRWYTGSGIYRDVYLVSANPVHIDLWGVHSYATKITPKVAEVAIKTTIDNNLTSKAGVTVVQEIFEAKGGKSVARSTTKLSIGAEAQAVTLQKLKVSSPKLWSLQSPYLYTVTTTVLEGSKVIDHSTHQLGLRTLTFDANTGFALNGEKMKLKGVCIHHDAGCLGAAVPRSVWERRLRVLKEIGINAIRLSHNPQAPDLYELCDQLGLMVKDEAFDEWEFPKKKWIEGWNVGTPGLQGSADFFEEWCERDVADMVRRDRNHASIVMWSIGNEVDYPNDPYSHPILNEAGIGQQHELGYQPNRPHADRMGAVAKRLIAAVKEYDTNRPVTGALAGPVMSNETEYPGALDVVGYNYTESRYQMDHAKYPQRIFYGSETRHDLDAWKAVRDNDFIMGQFIWTGLDYLGESGRWPSRGFTTGMVDLGGFIKARGYFRQALWAEAPMAYVGAYRIENEHKWLSMDAPALWNFEANDLVRAVCYTNCQEAELFLNGVKVGERKKYDDSSAMIYWDLPYQAGELKVVAYNDGRAVAESLIKTTSQPYALRASVLPVSPDDTSGLAHIVVEVVDQEGNKVWLSDNEVQCELQGPAKLLGMENSKSDDMGNHKDNRERVGNGRLLTYVQTVKGEGSVTVKFTSPWLQGTEVILK